MSSFPRIAPDDPPVPAPLPADAFVPARLDLYPANIILLSTSTSYANVRVIIGLDTLFVLKDGPTTSTGPLFCLILRFDDAYATRDDYRVVFDDQTEAIITKSGGCGCGSMLRGLRPFSEPLTAERTLERRDLPA